MNRRKGTNRVTRVSEIDKTLLTGGDHAGQHPGRGYGRGCVGRDGVRDLRLRRSWIIGRRTVDVIGAKLVVRHRLVIVVRVSAGAGARRRVLATAIRVAVGDKVTNRRVS